MAVARTPREVWVDAATRALAAGGGPQAVRVEALARLVGATKGSFYWHFADRDALLAAVLDTWEEHAGPPDVEGDGRERVRRLFSTPSERTVEPAVRDWARHDPAVARRLRRVDRRWLDRLGEAYGEFCDDEEAELRAVLTLTLIVGRRFTALGRGRRASAEAAERALARLLD
ncbi:transcriptional regulator, TetR family [Jatrophihabitans endophyticus]|uniref:Transcriptional regulator, TetR family n=1 Tax=Jatrophihabitans endophyticus TaxID=1206085 RepID=A0A1M5UMV7_9ACTN|nr:TetR/AcrR family transcriptional regulator [Jatrophihabitans endophyticus]SHH64250.1 transcriptional regulator, TetR family [Jatrophihabitans endophyticus]